MLKAFNLTGQKTETCRRWVYQDDRYQYETYERKVTVANRIFQDYEGNYTPVTVTFEAGTEFLLSRYNSAYGELSTVDLKCTVALRKGTKGLCLKLPIEAFSGMVANITPPET